VGDPDPLDVAARALRARDRSRRDVEERLARAGVDVQTRAETLETLERLGYVDDRRFARSRAEVLARRGYGDEWIRGDLAEHGVDPDVAADAMAGLEPEGERASALVARLGPSARTASRLVGKGFAAEAVEAALESGWREASPEL